MKPNFSHFLGFTFVLLALVVFSANAQDGAPGNEIPESNFLPELSTDLQDDKPLLIEHSGAEKTHSGKDQLNNSKSNRSLKPGEVAKNPATRPEEDDALSFNFLYYIIQKFKISDIVE